MIVDPIANLLQTQQHIILDGALATELERRGADINDRLWSAKILLEAPELIRQVHEDYFHAGADCATTASYQATVEGFARRGLNEQQALDLIGRSVTLAIEARDRFWAQRPGFRVRPFVAGSVGPYGAFLADGSEYRGDYDLSEADLIAFHRPRIAALVTAGADMLACETIPCLLEAQALVQLLTEFPTVSAWFSFSCRNHKQISNGERFADCAAWLDQHPQVAAIGVNCTAPEFLPELLRSAQAATTKPLIAYPNSGERYDAATRTWQGQSSCETFAEQARTWREAGAKVIGGCCRTTPDHIQALTR